MVPSQSDALHVPSLSPANACAGRCDAAPMKAAPERRRSTEGLHKLEAPPPSLWLSQPAPRMEMCPPACLSGMLKVAAGLRLLC